MIESPKADIGRLAPSLTSQSQSGKATVSAEDRAAFESALQKSDTPARTAASANREGPSPETLQSDRDRVLSQERREGSKPATSDAARHDLETGGTTDADESTGDLEADPEAVARFFEGTSSGFGTRETLAAGAAELPAETLDAEAMEALVSKILVAAPKEGGSEVRIYLSDNVLSGTEIILRRDSLGLLSIKCVTADPAAFQTLVSAQDDLKSRLEESEGDPVTIAVERDDREEGGRERRDSSDEDDNDENE